MASSLKLSEVARNAALDAILGLVQSEPGQFSLQLWEGDMPAEPDIYPTATYIGGVVALGPVFSAATAGSSSLIAPVGNESTAQAGTVEFFQFWHSVNGGVMQGSCGLVADNPDMVLNVKDVGVSNPISLDSATITFPGG